MKIQMKIKNLVMFFEDLINEKKNINEREHLV